MQLLFNCILSISLHFTQTATYQTKITKQKKHILNPLQMATIN